jgi:hypothetical protein
VVVGRHAEGRRHPRRGAVHLVPQRIEKGVEEAVQFKAVAAALPPHDLLVQVRHRQDDAFTRPLAVRIAGNGERLEGDGGDVGALEAGEGGPVGRLDRVRGQAEAPQIRLDLVIHKFVADH